MKNVRLAQLPNVIHVGGGRRQSTTPPSTEVHITRIQWYSDEFLNLFIQVTVDTDFIQAALWLFQCKFSEWPVILGISAYDLAAVNSKSYCFIGGCIGPEGTVLVNLTSLSITNIDIEGTTTFVGKTLPIPTITYSAGDGVLDLLPDPSIVF